MLKARRANDWAKQNGGIFLVRRCIRSLERCDWRCWFAGLSGGLGGASAFLLQQAMQPVHFAGQLELLIVSVAAGALAGSAGVALRNQATGSE